MSLVDLDETLADVGEEKKGNQMELPIKIMRDLAYKGVSYPQASNKPCSGEKKFINLERSLPSTYQRKGGRRRSTRGSLCCRREEKSTFTLPRG